MKRIMLDPGHGGSEPGAVHGEIFEKDLNLEVCEILKNKLEAQGFIVGMTRYQDTRVELKERCDISNLFKADLFVSVHHNAGGGQGYEVYHFTNSLEGLKIANLVGKYFDKIQQKRYIGSGMMAGSRQGDYYVLRNTNAVAILTEFCFIDNSKDFAKYDAEKQADAIFNAVCEYYDVEVSRVENSHWAEDIYQELNKKGIIIHEKRFDDSPTRAEVFALLNQLVK